MRRGVQAFRITRDRALVSDVVAFLEGRLLRRIASGAGLDRDRHRHGRDKRHRVHHEQAQWHATRAERPVRVGAQRVIGSAARHAHRVARLGMHRRVVGVGGEAPVFGQRRGRRRARRRGLAAETADRIVELEACIGWRRRRAGHRVGIAADEDFAGAAIDLLDVAVAGIQCLLRHLNEAGDIDGADDVAGNLGLERGERRGLGAVAIEHRQAGAQRARGAGASLARQALGDRGLGHHEDVVGGQVARRHLDDQVGRDHDVDAVDHHFCAREARRPRGAAVESELLDMADDCERRRAERRLGRCGRGYADDRADEGRVKQGRDELVHDDDSSLSGGTRLNAKAQPWTPPASRRRERSPLSPVHPRIEMPLRCWRPSTGRRRRAETTR